MLRERLPKAVVDYFSAEPPELQSDTFVEEELREHFSDRLFKVKTINGQAAFVYVLIEHKSTSDKKVGWQLLKYMVEILKRWEEKNPGWERLPAIVPFVFYHGARKWKIPDEFLPLVDAEEGWKPYLLNFRIPSMDLGKIPDQKLSADPHLRVRLLAMKYATRGKKQQVAAKESLVEALKEASGELRPVLFYLVQTYTPYDEETVQEIIQKVQPKEVDTMMSQFARDITKTVRQEALQKGIQRGMQRGMQQGIQQGFQKGEAGLLLRQLSRRFDPLPDEITQRIHAADANTIEIWADRILDAKSLDDVFVG
uniref:Transposase (putative) YhgA-like domain-containing protein n=1 Tax=Candidatus Kentrum sp. FM TaxID=2126340 RepID=A0A450RYQ2_9GAMM|nr:MAG: conserved hypothetical protein (putative transposase or invertase) [Candidatus Kentron sp. FM]VFJ64121.1 MAG: conserved hypothetical protein (putative transposase or invertase) [Candidatus Kentron sp. FM]VFK08950.1 MAG: conserved hypothetical protein (putative transposase or invertase) [Candidatus Kentron sp. FM]